MSKIFKTEQSDLTKYNGTEVEIIRELTKEEADIEEVGRMFKVRFCDGTEGEAFEDELMEKEIKEFFVYSTEDIKRVKEKLLEKTKNKDDYSFTEKDIKEIADRLEEELNNNEKICDMINKEISIAVMEQFAKKFGEEKVKRYRKENRLKTILEDYASENEKDYGDCSTCSNYGKCYKCDHCEEGSKYSFDTDGYLLDLLKAYISINPRIKWEINKYR